MAGGQVTVAGERQNPVVAVVSPKGGSGKTMVATNLASAFAIHVPSILIDLDVYCGDVEWAFGLHPAYRVNDAARRLREDAATEVGAMFTPHGERLSLLCAPDSHIAGDSVQAADVTTIARQLLALDRPLIFDTSPGMSDLTLDALEGATHMVVVTTTDVASVQAARKLLDTAASLRLDSARTMLVLNRSTTRTGLATNDIEHRLGMSPTMQIPDSRHVAESLNTGRPFVETHPDSHIAGDFVSLADSLLGIEPPRRGGFWRRVTS